MLKKLLSLLKEPKLTRAETTWILRTVFKISFWFQAALAIIIFSISLPLLQIPKEANPIIGQALLITSFLLLPISLLIAHFFAIKGGKEAALASVICFATLLAISVWLMLFAYLVGVKIILLAGLAFISLSYYVLGLKLSKNYVKLFFKEEKS